MIKAIVIDKSDTRYDATVHLLSASTLPLGNVTVKVEYSTLNYKDALAITGQGGSVVRQFPMVPGIDLAGTVLQSEDPAYRIGDSVLLNGWGLGEKHWGGLAQHARLSGEWLTPLPSGISTRQAMAIGTAGYTAMLSLLALERQGLHPEDGEVLVTGANGGVGSIAIILLAHHGYRVVASTGRPQEAAYLTMLGAQEIIDRSSLSKPGKPLQTERWAAAIDSVGSHTLANVCASIRSNGSVATCGLAQGMDFPSTVAPFILRGINLLGINSVTQPKHARMEAWARLAKDLDLTKLEAITQEIGLEDTISAAYDLLEGKVRGRLVVDVNR